ncbi:hypothetical protein SNE40_002789 [Patella caerulea]|uniref:Uncharacterized protein n=1 Tax=Patella caerulea TaxID=87958 RepID=A0AAN8KCX5_PATCE
MAERRSKRIRLNIESSDDTQRDINPANLTVAELKSALRDIGIILNGNLSHGTLKRIYLDNVNVVENATSTTSTTNRRRRTDVETDTVNSRNTSVIRVASEEPSDNRNSILLPTGANSIVGGHPPSEEENGSTSVPSQRCASARRDVSTAHDQMPSTSGINNMEAMIMSTLKLCQQSIETVRCLASTSN